MRSEQTTQRTQRSITVLLTHSVRLPNTSTSSQEMRCVCADAQTQNENDPTMTKLVIFGGG